MSKKHKRHAPSSPGGSNRPAGKPVSRTEVFRAEEREPVAERRPVPIWLILLLVLLLFWGDMYLMGHGADVAGSTGAFPKAVFDPYKDYQEVVRNNPVSEADRMLAVGRAKFELLCSGCHQSSGMGNPSTGIPPLAGSEWVTAPGSGRLTRIVMNAVKGPIKVAGKDYDNSTMLAWASVVTSDEEFAALLTYIRSNKAWGNGASPVNPEAVKKIRAEVESRSEAWTSPELLKIPETE